MWTVSSISCTKFILLIQYFRFWKFSDPVLSKMVTRRDTLKEHLSLALTLGKYDKNSDIDRNDPYRSICEVLSYQFDVTW